jgi:DNA transposition AAA+ family ATPase
MSLVEELKELLKKKKYAVSYAAKAINVSNATLHLWINNNYKGNVKKIDDAVANFIEIEKLREGRIRVDFVRTSIVDAVFDIAKTCHVENEIGVCYGDAGIGKTYAVKSYAIDNTDVILIEADLGYTPKVLFSKSIKS